MRKVRFEPADSDVARASRPRCFAHQQNAQAAKSHRSCVQLAPHTSVDVVGAQKPGVLSAQAAAVDQGEQHSVAAGAGRPQERRDLALGVNLGAHGLAPARGHTPNAGLAPVAQDPLL